MKKLNKKQIKKISEPWISNYITKLISHRERLFNKKERNPLSIEIKRAYTLFRNRITREIKKAKKEYYKNYFQVNMNNNEESMERNQEYIEHKLIKVTLIFHNSLLMVKP